MISRKVDVAGIAFRVLSPLFPPGHKAELQIVDHSFFRAEARKQLLIIIAKTIKHAKRLFHLVKLHFALKLKCLVQRFIMK